MNCFRYNGGMTTDILAPHGPFSALVARMEGENFRVAPEEASAGLLADGDTLVRVAFSSVNYKDALAVCGKKIIRKFPLIPGIDFAGTVEESSGDFAKGDAVILTGWGVGERESGGFSQYARAPSSRLTRVPEGLDARKAMLCGTAGLTAAMCVNGLFAESAPALGAGAGEHPRGGVAPRRRVLREGDEVVVSGASGGVGSFAVRMLARMGFSVVAVSRPEAEEYVRGLGAAAVVSREEMSADARPLEKGRWRGAVDAVGGKVLARILAECDYNAIVSACGLAGGAELATTVMPFILRGVRLEGVDSVMAPPAMREAAWALLAEHMTEDFCAQVEGETIGLSEVPAAGRKVLKGDFNGRILVDCGR